MREVSVEKVSYGRVFFYSMVTVLWAACFCSAIGVVYSAFSSRQEMQALEELRREAAGMRVMSGQYMLEKSSWAAYSRVETIAREKLQMHPPESGQTVLVYRE